MYNTVEDIENAIKNLTQVQAAYFEKVVKMNLPEITTAQSILDMLKDGEKHEAARRAHRLAFFFLFDLAVFGGCTLNEIQFFQLYNAIETENQALRSLIHG